MRDTVSEIRLTSTSKGAGCGCKIAPDVLQKILGNQLQDVSFDKLLIGNSTWDDASVYELDNVSALISSTDFFTPIVDEPYDFGWIAACNALSDIYAMGGRPILAQAILCWPVEKIDAIHANRVLQGGADACTKAGIPLAGGHSIESSEPIFGLAVNGLIDRRHLKTNAGASPGDALYLTKPLGTGILSTALKREKLTSEHFSLLNANLLKLNDVGTALGHVSEVNAMTDVTGFGLLGHLLEMCKASGNCVQLDRNAIPVLNGVEDYLAQGIYPDGAFRNWRSYGDSVKGVEGTDVLVYSDPQSNGGLLISVSQNGIPKIESIMNEHSLGIHKIGTISSAWVSDSPMIVVD